MTLVIGALTMGFILSLLSMGVWLGFRVLRYTDITVDGSLTLGAAVAAVLIAAGHNPWMATVAACLAGALAGATTGILHTRFRIQELLSGILVMTALYSVNLRVMGRSNIPLLDTRSVSDVFEQLLGGLAPRGNLLVLGWKVGVRDLAMLLTAACLTVLVGVGIRWFLHTHAGTALRATGENAQMVRAQGINHRKMQVFGLLVANGLVGLAGALLAQYQGFADVQMGIGMIVWGLASVIIGEALVARQNPGLALCGAVLGTLLFRLLVAIALRWGLDPNDLRLVTAVFVFGALILPDRLKALTKRMRGGAHHG